jgi:hypothetical protein
MDAGSHRYKMEKIEVRQSRTKQFGARLTLFGPCVHRSPAWLDATTLSQFQIADQYVRGDVCFAASTHVINRFIYVSHLRGIITDAHNQSPV